MAKWLFLSKDGKHVVTRAYCLSYGDEFKFFMSEHARIVTRISEDRIYYRRLNSWPYSSRHNGFLESLGAKSKQIIYLIKSKS